MASIAGSIGGARTRRACQSFLDGTYYGRVDVFARGQAQTENDMRNFAAK
jgi:hypothetical protein